MKFVPRIPSPRKRIAARTSPLTVRYKMDRPNLCGWAPPGTLAHDAYVLTETATDFKNACGYYRFQSWTQERPRLVCVLIWALAALVIIGMAQNITSPAHAQHTSFYGPSGAYLGYSYTAPPSLPPGAIPRATVEGMSVDPANCPEGNPSDSIRKFLPAGIEPAPGYGWCSAGRRSVGN
jgi:hypothetical protein